MSTSFLQSLSQKIQQDSNLIKAPNKSDDMDATTNILESSTFLTKNNDDTSNNNPLLQLNHLDKFAQHIRSTNNIPIKPPRSKVRDIYDSLRQQSEISTAPKGKIRKVQLVMMDPKVMMKYKATMITTDALHKQKIPVRGSINSVELGNSDANGICQICGLQNCKGCANPMGILKFATPLPHPWNRTYIKYIFHCVCWFCSKPLLLPTSDKFIALQEQNIETVEEYLKIFATKCLNLRHCPHCTGEVFQFKWNQLFLLRYHKPKKATLKSAAAASAVANAAGSAISSAKNEPLPCTHRMCFDVLKYISDENSDRLRFQTPDSRPERLYTEMLIVPSKGLWVENRYGSDTKAGGSHAMRRRLDDIVKAAFVLNQQCQDLIREQYLTSLGKTVIKPNLKAKRDANRAALKRVSKRKLVTPITEEDIDVMRKQQKLDSTYMSQDSKDDTMSSYSSSSTIIDEITKEDAGEEEKEKEKETTSTGRKRRVPTTIPAIFQRKTGERNAILTRQKNKLIIEFDTEDGDVSITSPPTINGIPSSTIDETGLPVWEEVNFDPSQWPETRDYVDALQYKYWTYICHTINVEPPRLLKNKAQNNPSQSITSLLVGKTAHIRGNMGKRVDFSARFVITPNPYLATDQCGVPLVLMMNHTKEEYVTKYNIVKLSRAVKNGPDVHPGANIVTTPKGRVIDLRFEDRYSFKLKIGMRVERHLVNGDQMFLDRPPSLSRASLMCFSIIETPDPTIQLNLTSTTAQGADFDGDCEMALTCRSVYSNIEGKYVGNVANQILNPKNSTILIGMIQDAIVALWLLTRIDTFFNELDYMRYNAQCLQQDLGRRLKDPVICEKIIDPFGRKDKWLWLRTGKQLVSELFPSNLHYNDHMNYYQDPLWQKIRNPSPEVPAPHDWIVTKTLDQQWNDLRSRWKKYGLNEKNIVVVSGQFIKGTIRKKDMGAGSKGLAHSIATLSLDLYAYVISECQKLTSLFMMDQGFSCGISGLVLENKSDLVVELKETVKMIQEHPAFNKRFRSMIEDDPRNKEFDDRNVNSDTITSMGINKKNKSKQNLIEQTREEMFCQLLDAANSHVSKKATNTIDSGNTFGIMIESGAKGNTYNYSQMAVSVSQQIVGGTRQALEGRITSHHPSHSSHLKTSIDTAQKDLNYDELEQKGLIFPSFADGLSQYNSFCHSMSGLEGVISTAIKTQASGHLFRKSYKTFESLIVHHDFSIRDSYGTIIEERFGYDGLNPARVPLMKYPVLRKSYEDFEQELSALPWIEFLWNEYETKIKSTSVYALRDIQDLDLLLKTEMKILKDRKKQFLSQRCALIGSEITTDLEVPVKLKELIQNVIHQNKLKHSNYLFYNNDTDLQHSNQTILPPSVLIRSIWTFIEDMYKFFPIIFPSGRLYHFELALLLELNVRKLILEYRFSLEMLQDLLFSIMEQFKLAFVNIGDSMGSISAQSLSQDDTQGSLSKFHQAGIGGGETSLSKYFNLAMQPKNPTMKLYLRSIEEIEERMPLSTINRIRNNVCRQLRLNINDVFNAPSNSLPDNIRYKYYLELAEYVAQQIIHRSLDFVILSSYNSQSNNKLKMSQSTGNYYNSTPTGIENSTPTGIENSTPTGTENSTPTGVENRTPSGTESDETISQTVNASSNDLIYESDLLQTTLKEDKEWFDNTLFLLDNQEKSELKQRSNWVIRYEINAERCSILNLGIEQIKNSIKRFFQTRNTELSRKKKHVSFDPNDAANAGEDAQEISHKARDDDADDEDEEDEEDDDEEGIFSSSLNKLSQKQIIQNKLEKLKEPLFKSNTIVILSSPLLLDPITNVKKWILRIYVLTNSKYFESLLRNRVVQADIFKAVQLLSLNIQKETVIHGIPKIQETGVVMKAHSVINPITGAVEQIDEPVIQTTGSNLLRALTCPYLDPNRSSSDNLNEMYNIWGIDVSSSYLSRGVQQEAGKVDRRYCELVVNLMTHQGKLMAVQSNNTFKNKKISFLQRMSYERPIPALVEACISGEQDFLKGPTENIMMGNLPPIGTGFVKRRVRGGVPEEIELDLSELRENHIRFARQNTINEITPMDMRVLFEGSPERCTYDCKIMNHHKDHYINVSLQKYLSETVPLSIETLTDGTNVVVDFNIDGDNNKADNSKRNKKRKLNERSDKKYEYSELNSLTTRIALHHKRFKQAQLQRVVRNDTNRGVYLYKQRVETARVIPKTINETLHSLRTTSINDNVNHYGASDRFVQSTLQKLVK